MTSANRRTRPTDTGSRPDPKDDSLLQIIWRQKVLICLVTFLAAGAGFAYLAIAPKVYTAISRVLVQRAAPQLSEHQAVNISDSNSETFLYQEAELIKSAPILYMALGGLNVDEMSTFQGIPNPMAFLKRELGVDVGKKDGLIAVSFACKDNEEVDKIVDCVIESYKAFKSKQRRSTAADVLAILQKDKDKTDGELAARLEEMLKFKQTTNTLSFEGDKGNFIMQRADKLADALTTAHIETINLKTAYEASARTLADDPEAMAKLENQGGVLLSPQDEEMLRANLFGLKQSLAEKERILGAAHPNVQSLKAQISQLNQAYVSSAGLRWKSAVKREEEFQKAFDDQQKLAMDLSSKSAEYQHLQNDVTQLQKRSDDLDNRIKDVQLTLDAGAMNITVLESADWKDQPVKPFAGQIMGLSVCLGLLLGCVAGVAREWIDPRLRSETDVKSSIGVPVLGTIPHMPGTQSPEVLGWTVHLDPASDAAEAYRTVRTSLQFGVSEGEARTIVVSSPAPRDGKSTLSSNLAIAMAKSGKSVLIIDADFRSPSQHRIFGVSAEVGFSSVLMAGEMVDRAIRRTTVERLHVMPSGPAVRNPSELLNSPALGEILDGLNKTYDHIVIDTPPVSKVDDARIVAASCDYTLLVLRADKSRKLAEDARDRLMSVGARILGVVLNDISGMGGSGFGGMSGLLRGDAREPEQQLAAEDVDSHGEVRPVSGSGRMI